MNERSSKRKKPKRDHDFAVNAFRVVQEAIGEAPPQETPEPELTPEERHDIAAKLGRLGGKKGGPARAASMTAERRREIAKKAAKARWQKKTNR